jgi:prepilin-type N-terminal cleavage/methylation domain-containing protein
MKRFARRGFTLVELLLVLVIVALLAALLFPVLQAARKQANMATCAGNLRQLSMGYGMYLQDYGSYAELIRFVQWMRDERHSRAVLTCPEDPDPTSAASSYTFRTVLPPDFKPLAQRPDVEASTVLVDCPHHLGQQVFRHGQARQRTAVRYPYRLVLRASGAVERIRDDRIERVLVRGPRLRRALLYPGEEGYLVARSQ